MGDTTGVGDALDSNGSYYHYPFPCLALGVDRGLGIFRFGCVVSSNDLGKGTLDGLCVYRRAVVLDGYLVLIQLAMAV